MRLSIYGEERQKTTLICLQWDLYSTTTLVSLIEIYQNQIKAALRAVFSNFQLSSFGREKMKFLKLSQMNGLDKWFTKIYFTVQFDSHFSAGATILILPLWEGFQRPFRAHFLTICQAKKTLKIQVKNHYSKKANVAWYVDRRFW